MEIFPGSTRTFSIDFPLTPTNIDAWIVVDGIRVHEFNTVMADGEGKWSVVVPYRFTSQDQDFLIRWEVSYLEGTLQTHVEEQSVSVVSPILPIEEIARISESDNLEDNLDLERRVRYAIQSYTGQQFGKYRTTYEVRGSGGPNLVLPAPLLELTAATFPTSRVQLFNGGTLLTYPDQIWFGIKDAPPEEVLDQFYYTNGPIRVWNNQAFTDGRRFKIQGIWGYHAVPGDVKQAARLLAADFACDESLWRDRYMDSVRAGNWRYEVNELAFQGTGNVVVDQILGKYRKITLVAV